MRMTSSISRVFRLVDTEGSGTIDKAELLLAMRNNPEVRSMLEESPGLSALLRPQAWGQAFAKIDTNHSELISLSEFTNFALDRPLKRARRRQVAEADAARVFRLMDVDGDGALDPAEILDALRNSSAVTAVLRCR